jgi:hypothetical protein
MKKHIELNDKDSSFLANATWFFGEAEWNRKGKKKKDTFLSISDCYNTIRIHTNSHKFKEDKKKFIKKLKKLRDFIDDYISYIDKQNWK